MNPFYPENADVRDFLVSVADEPWERGVHDCVTFINDYADIVFGKPYANVDDYPFYDLKTAILACRKICRDNGVDDFHDVLDKHYARSTEPVEGCIVAKADNEGITGYTYGVVYNGFGYFVGEEGLKQLELDLNNDLYWGVV